MQNRGRNPQLAAIATPPPTYQLCKDAEALCLLSGPLGLLRRRQARPHANLPALLHDRVRRLTAEAEAVAAAAADSDKNKSSTAAARL